MLLTFWKMLKRKSEPSNSGVDISEDNDKVKDSCVDFQEESVVSITEVIPFQHVGDVGVSQSVLQLYTYTLPNMETPWSSIHGDGTYATCFIIFIHEQGGEINGASKHFMAFRGNHKVQMAIFLHLLATKYRPCRVYP